MESPILQGLNPAQRAAVEAYDSASLIIAGAGSGKTRVLTSRIAYMIQKGIKPKNILATTFTNKAAQEMRERIVKMIPEHLTEGQARHIWMATGICRPQYFVERRRSGGETMELPACKAVGAYHPQRDTA